MSSIPLIMQAIKSKQTRITKNFEFKKKQGSIEIKSKETRSKQKVMKQGTSFRLVIQFIKI